MERNVSYLRQRLVFAAHVPASPYHQAGCHLFSNAARKGGILNGMRASFSQIATCCCALLVSSTALADEVDTMPAPELDLGRYLGTWHETARIDNLFERGLHAVTALYERLADGRIRVTNSGTAADGKRHDVVGMARPAPDATSDGGLEVSFVPPYSHFFSDYRILYVTPDYSGALVSDADGDMLWLLERNEKSNPEVRQRLLDEAQQRGFDTSELIFDEEAPPACEASEPAVNAE